MAQIEKIIELRNSIQDRKVTADQTRPVLDVAAIICASIPGLGGAGALIDKVSARLGPDVEKAIVELAGLTAQLGGDLNKLDDDVSRLEIVLTTFAANQALQDRLVAIASTLASEDVEIISSNGAKQTFRDVVLEKLGLEVRASSGSLNHLIGVDQSGGGASFMADGAENIVERSKFAGSNSSVHVGAAALRSVHLNTPNAGMEIIADGEYSVGMMIGGDGHGAAVWIPGPGGGNQIRPAPAPRQPEYLSAPIPPKRDFYG